MNLKEFIVETISGIIEATEELQSGFEGRGVIVNPPVSFKERDLYRHEDERTTYRRIETIEFDVAVTAASELNGGGKASLKVFSVEATLDGGGAKRHEEVSRVRFSLPVVLSPAAVKGVNRTASDEKDRTGSTEWKEHTSGSASVQK